MDKMKINGDFDFELKCTNPKCCSFGKFTKGRIYECRVFEMVKAEIVDDTGSIIQLEHLDGFKII